MISLNIFHLAVFAVLCFNTVHGAFSTAECGKTKHCMRYPQNCDTATSTCYFFSWIWNGTVFDMELSGGTGLGNTYSGIAFGEINGMQDADLYYCTGTTLESGVITNNQQQPTQLNINTLAGAVSVISTETTGGVAKCRFTRVASVTKAITTGPKGFNLTNRPYYILMAGGSIQRGVMQQHTARTISSSTINMAAPFTTTPAPGPKSTTASSAPTTTAVIPCGGSKRCYQYPTGCQQDSANCIFFSWIYNATAKTFDMEISGGVGGGGTYAAVGFSAVNQMKDADVYYCTGNSLESAVIGTRHSAPTKLNIAQEAGITNIKSVTTNGRAKCWFTRAASITKTISTGATNFDLTKNDYHILVAQGNVVSGSLQRHDPENREVSSKMKFVSSAPGAYRIGFTTTALILITSLFSILNN